jgi:hypothetical protein
MLTVNGAVTYVTEYDFVPGSGGAWDGPVQVMVYDPTGGGWVVDVVAVLVQAIGGCVMPSEVSVSVPTRPVGFSVYVVGRGELYGTVTAAGAIVSTPGLTVNTPLV